MLLLHNALKQVFLKLSLGLVKPELKYLHALVQCFGATDVQTTTLILKITNLTITFKKRHSKTSKILFVF